MIVTYSTVRERGWELIRGDMRLSQGLLAQWFRADDGSMREVRKPRCCGRGRLYALYTYAGKRRYIGRHQRGQVQCLLSLWHFLSIIMLTYRVHTVFALLRVLQVAISPNVHATHLGLK